METTAPIAEVISIGDEMTSGARMDTNSQWLSRELGKLGFRVLFHTTVGDSLDACLDVFSHAMRRAQCVVMTGGLGPTADDLTRQAIADATGCPLHFDPESLAHIESIFARRGRDMPPQNRIQAMFPEGCQVIPNPNGTAPGIDLTIHDPQCRIIALPGVPAEMQEMWEASVVPTMSGEGESRAVIRNAVVKCFGLGESEMESRLGGMIARERSPRVGITVSKATISLRIEAIAPSHEEAMHQIEETRQEIYSRVGDFVFGEGEVFELEHAVIDALRKRGDTLATVECGGDCVLAGVFARADAADVVTRCVFFPDGLLLPACFDGQSQNTTPVDPELAQLLHPPTNLPSTRSKWILVIAGYPQLQPSSQHPPTAETRRSAPMHVSPPRIKFSIYRSSPNGNDLAGSSNIVELVHQSEETIGGHWEIVASRIAKTGMQKLLHCLQTM